MINLVKTQQFIQLFLNTYFSLKGYHHVEYNISPFQSNFSANRILPSSYLFWAGKRLVDYL
jgi:hypothetical protein